MSSQQDNSGATTATQSTLRKIGVVIVTLGLLVIATHGSLRACDPIVVIKFSLLYIAVATTGAYYFARKDSHAAANRCATVAVCVVPCLVYGLQSATGWLMPSSRPLFVPIHRCVIDMHAHATPMICATMVASALACMVMPVPHPLLTLPHALALSSMGVEIAHIWEIANVHHFATLWGTVMLLYGWVAARWATRSCDYARYFYILGALVMWTHATQIYTTGHSFPLSYAILNVLTVIAGNNMDRGVFKLLGWFGLFIYVTHEAQRMDKLTFAVATVFVGLCFIFVSEISSRIQALLDSIVKFQPQTDALTATQ